MTQFIQGGILFLAYPFLSFCGGQALKPFFIHLLGTGSGVSPDKTQLRQDLETTPTGVDFTPTRRELTSTGLDFTDKTIFSPESTAMQQTVIFFK